MKRVLYSLMVLAIVFLASCNQSSKNSSQQQSFGPGGGMGPGNFDPQAMVDRQMEQMKETLDLSGDQEKQIRGIIEEGFETMQKSREDMQNGGGDFEGMREKMQQMREEQNKKIKVILSDDQWEKYEAYQEEMRSRRGQGGPGGPGGMPQN